MGSATRRVQLGEGWSIEVPAAFTSRRNPDGSWSAWDSDRVVDVQMLSTEGPNGVPIDAATMLGGFESGSHQWERRDTGMLGVADLVDEGDDQGWLFRLRTETAVQNRLLSCWFAFRDQAQLDWALNTWKSATNDG